MKSTNLAFALTILTLVTACTTPATTSSPDLTGTYTGSTQTRAVKPSGEEFWSGKLEGQITIADGGAVFFPTYKTLKFKGEDITEKARYVTWQGYKNGLQITFVMGGGLNCSNVLIKGTISGLRLEFPAGNSDVSCPITGRVGTVSWSAFTLERQ